MELQRTTSISSRSVGAVERVASLSPRFHEITENNQIIAEGEELGGEDDEERIFHQWRRPQPVRDREPEASQNAIFHGRVDDSLTPTAYNRR
jgi:hypothetical protein